MTKRCSNCTHGKLTPQKTYFDEGRYWCDEWETTFYDSPYWRCYKYVSKETGLPIWYNGQSMESLEEEIMNWDK